MCITVGSTPIVLYRIVIWANLKIHATTDDERMIEKEP
jgi:hypothetical protein